MPSMSLVGLTCFDCVTQGYAGKIVKTHLVCTSKNISFSIHHQSISHKLPPYCPQSSAFKMSPVSLSVT